jgi:hypothetical protein
MMTLHYMPYLSLHAHAGGYLDIGYNKIIHNLVFYHSSVPKEFVPQYVHTKIQRSHQ